MIFISIKEEELEPNNIEYRDGTKPKFYGYSHQMSDQQIWEYNRGIYRLGKAATKEHYVVFVFRKKVVLVAHITELVPYRDTGRYYFEGGPVDSSDFVYKKWVGETVPATRQPIRYETDPDFDKPNSGKQVHTWLAQDDLLAYYGAVFDFSSLKWRDSEGAGQAFGIGQKSLEARVENIRYVMALLKGETAPKGMSNYAKQTKAIVNFLELQLQNSKSELAFEKSLRELLYDFADLRSKN